MVRIKFLIAVIIYIIVFIMHYSNNRKNSIRYKRIFDYCKDNEINHAFNKLNVTGVTFIKRLLKDKKFNLVILDKGNIGAKVNRGMVFVEQDFKKNLTLETFRDSLHEYRHVLDYSKVRMKNILVSIVIVCIVLVTLSKLSIFRIYVHISIYPILRLILLMLLLIIVTICAILDIFLEVNAITYPAENCDTYLRELLYETTMIEKTKNYLIERVRDEIKWYKISIICNYLTILAALLIVF